MGQFIFLLFILGAQIGRAQDSLQTNIPVHDPVMIRQEGVYYVFATGRGISMWSSKDMQNWKKEKPVFHAPPDWAPKAVPGFKGHIWAPDVSYHNGLYHLYYSISTFGKNRSCIGLATNKTLNPASADYRWTDHGQVIESVAGSASTADGPSRPHLFSENSIISTCLPPMIIVAGAKKVLAKCALAVLKR